MAGYGLDDGDTYSRLFIEVKNWMDVDVIFENGVEGRLFCDWVEVERKEGRKEGRESRGRSKV